MFGFQIQWGDKRYTIVDRSGNKLASFESYNKAHEELQRLEVEFLREREKNRKREKTVYPTDEIPLLWAHKIKRGASSPKPGHVFFDGDAIYSYGRHFVIAAHAYNDKKEHAILFNSQKYSVSTGRHQQMVRSALPPNVPVFEVPINYDSRQNYYRDVYLQQIRAAVFARHESSVSYHLRRAEELKNELKAYCLFFDLQVPELPAIPENNRAALKARRRQLWEEQVAEKITHQLLHGSPR